MRPRFVRILYHGRGRRQALLEKEVPLEEPRYPDFRLIGDELRCRKVEHLVEFFQGELFGFSDKEEDHGPCDEVETGIETDYNIS